MVNTWRRLWFGPTARRPAGPAARPSDSLPSCGEGLGWRVGATTAVGDAPLPRPCPTLRGRREPRGAPQPLKNGLAETGRAPRWRADADPWARPRLLFINQYYWPDHASTAQHLTDLAESLAERGYECHVLCSCRGYRADHTRYPRHEVRHGVHIHRVGATAFGRRTTRARMADYLSFHARAVWKSLTLPRFDVVVTLTTPPMIGLVGTLLRRLRGSRHVLWSMDLHPDASLALGRMSIRNPIVAALARLSDAIYRAADEVVVLGPYMADRIAAKHVKRERIITIPVWSRRDEVYPLPRDQHPLRKHLGWEEKFVAMYSGNLGLAHSFAEFLEAARRLRDRFDIVFLYVGDGPRLTEVREAKEREGLDNIRLMDYFARDQLHTSLSLADVHLISMRAEMTGVVVPGKLYGAMASGRPAVFVGPDHCESADTIRRAECGFTIRNGDVDGLVDALKRLAADRELAHRLGQNGRAAFLEAHEKDVCCAQWGWMIAEQLGMPATIPLPISNRHRAAPAQGPLNLI
jgi:colanic acid biosynthesis glycosyl transferase WcaI